MKKNNIRNILIAATILAPSVSFAALDGIKGLLRATVDVINLVIPVIFGLALIFFFWGLIQFIGNAGVEKAREEGKQKMIWGIIALFVMVAIFGILNWISDAVGITIDTNPNNIIPRTTI